MSEEKTVELNELSEKEEAIRRKHTSLQEEIKETERKLSTMKEREQYSVQLSYLLREEKDAKEEIRSSTAVFSSSLEQRDDAMFFQSLENEMAQLGQIKNKLKAQQQLIEAYRQRQQHIELLKKDLEQLQEQESNSVKQIEEQSKELRQLDKEELRKKEAQLATEQKQQQEIEKVLVQLKEQYRQLEERKQQLTVRVTQLQILKKEAEQLGKLHHWIEQFFRKMVVAMEKKHLHTVHYNFNEAFSTWFSRFIEHNLSARLDDSFSPLLEQNGHDTTLQHLSGGEKTSCALAYRLALNKVINNIVQHVHTKELLILDEPTDGFSSEQLNIVREVLKELQLKQIIIVSHEEKIESFVEHFIQIEKKNHISRIAQSF